MSNELKLFFSTNCTSGYESSVREVCRDINVVPFIYSGITLSVQGSSLDKEIREDLYASKIAILLIVAKSSTGERIDVKDNWLLKEINSIDKSKIHLLIYASQTVSQAEIDQLNLPITVVRFDNEAAFKESLKNEISFLIESN